MRRRILLDAARALLETHDLDQLSLGNVAEHAGVPKGSAYHFFASIYELYADLSRLIAEELRDGQLDPIEGPVTNWHMVLGVAIDRGAAFFNANTAARQLILGPKSPPEIKRSDREADYEIARSIEAQIGSHFVLPDIPERTVLFFRAVEIADLMFCLSVLDHGLITPQMLEESKKAALAYLSLYIPSFLTPAPAASDPLTALADAAKAR